ncbi:MAG: hypothetical protein K2X99_00540 [Gemmatimonadaceae bacterium]|nr:hypothetical protein [Gemmatimonadaceae bacterium]
MRILLPLLVLATASLARPTTGSAQTSSDTLPIAERRRIVREIDAFTREHFAHWSALGTQSYDSMVAALRTQTEQRADRRDFDDAVLAFTAGLRNGHTRFTDAWRARTDGQTLWLWLWLWPTTEGWTVTGSEIPGLSRGAVITHIDESPIDSAYARARPRIIDSNERMRRYGWTLADYLWPRRFTVTLSDGRRVAVTRGEPSDSSVRAQRAGQPPVAHRWIVKDSIAYVRVPRFSPALYEDSAVTII